MQTTRRPFLPPRWFIRAAWAVHRAIYRLSGRRRGLRPPTPATYGMLRIHTIGRRDPVDSMSRNPLGRFQLLLGAVQEMPSLPTTVL